MLHRRPVEPSCRALAALALTVIVATPLLAAPRAAAPGAKPARGKFLVATRGLLDPNFVQTVVLLIDYGPEGALGVIVNRPTEMKLSLALPQLEAAGERPDVLWEGGPVMPAGMLFLMRGGGDGDDARHVFADVHAGVRLELLEQTLARGTPPERLRIYSGHSGWAPGQLDAELARGDWLVLPGDADLVFTAEPSEVWPRLIRHESDLVASVEIPGTGTTVDVGEIAG